MEQASTDGELWRLAADGRAEAFGALFERHARAVYNHCFRRTADWSAAEDLVSVVFLEAWRRRGEVRVERDSALPWLLGVANNVLRNRRRSLRRHAAALARLPAPPAEPDPAEGVAERVDLERRMRRLAAAMERLPLRYREVVELCLWSGLGYAEAAVALGVPVGTVRSRLSRAKARLRALGAAAEDGAGDAAEPAGRGGHGWGGRGTALRVSEEGT
ncbi:RNA polymerase sigma factor [Allonocardiopsis opalescens]|uniref:RNA polymerase ECF family sigma subunit n=1 Tax=Allonocardiopsis opalescens TaxID=1144618 RepID=A0A2T0Q7R3_9ACTN|nr:RNA polymerase sigma factor [Allonocardiopsis opalescens]PRX99859.1 RNA polymerase ECF family sigma subunit [Allonocardiopsis opalescens]